MARRALVEILGDSSNFVASLRTSAAATQSFSTDLRKLGVNAKASADAQVAASVRKTARLREEIVAYREIAAAAVRGSREQVAATNLAAAAEGRLARSMGVTAHEAVSLRSSTAGFERDFSRATRGVAAGSGLFRALGRSIAFASGGFLAFATGGQFLRASFDAAKEQIVVQRQMAAQFRATGKNVSDYQGQIDSLANHLGLLAGFQNDEVKSAFTTIFRTTRDVSKALRDTALAADLARAKHMSLAQAGLILAKVEAGNTTLLRRQGFEIAKHATAQQALAVLEKQVAGQAKAGTTEQERFGAVLHNTEEIIGTGLLPTVNKYLASGAAWLTQMNESGRLQRDVAGGVQDVVKGIRLTVGAFQAAISVIRTVDKVTGSLGNTLQDLAAAWLVLRARTKLIEWGVLTSGLSSTGAAAAAAEGEVTGLSAALLKLRGLGPIAVAVGISEFVSFARSETKSLGAQRAGMFTLKGSSQQYAIGGRGGVFAAGKVGPSSPLGPLAGITATGSAAAETAASPRNQQHAAQTAVDLSVKRAAERGLSLQGQFNLLELKRENAAIGNNTALQRAILVQEEAITLKLRDQAKKLKDRTAYATQAASIEDQIRSIDAQAASTAKTRRDKAAAAAKKAKEAAAKAALGGVSLELQLREAKADALAAGTGATSLTSGQIAARKAIRDAEYRAIRSHKLSMQGLIDAWNQIAQINTELASQTGKTASNYAAVSTKALTAGLKLSRDQALIIRQRAAQMAAHGGYAPTGPAAQGVPIIIHNVHLPGVLNVDDFVNQLQRRRKHNAAQTRGRHGGYSLGIN